MSYVDRYGYVVIYVFLSVISMYIYGLCYFRIVY